MYAIFNKKSKEFIGFSPNQAITTGNVLFKEIGDTIDVGLYRWEGNYDNGQIVAKSSTRYIIDEYKVEQKFFNKITRKYPVIAQLKVIIDQLDEVIDDSDKTSEFVKLKGYLETLQKNHEKRIDHFKNSADHEYYSKDDIDEKLDKAFEV